MNRAVVCCRSLKRDFGVGRRRIVAVDSLSLEINPGEIVGVVGQNGAGKSTLLRILAGDLPPTSGEATIAGHGVGTPGARRLVGYAADPPLAPAELSALEWLNYLASHRASSASSRLSLVRRAIEIGELGSFVGRRIGRYSRGMALRLAIAVAILCGPAVVLVDEAIGGVDPLVARRLGDSLAELAIAGRVLVVASHDLAILERLATRILVLHAGRVVRDLPTASLLAQRVAELALQDRPGFERLKRRLPDARPTREGLRVPLPRGITMEQLLATCRTERVTVTASRVRYPALDEVITDAVGGAE